MVQKVGILCRNLFLGLKFTCNNIVLDNLTLLCMVVQRSKVYVAKCTVTGRLPVMEVPEIGELK